MTQPTSTSRPPKIRCSPTGPAPSACRRSARIKPEHFRPAFDAALAAVTAPRSTAIAADPAPPSFDNTIVALEKSGRDLDRVANVFFVKAGADTGDAIEAIERDVSPLLARHNNALYLNRALFARIADLYARRDALGLDAEQARLLDRYHTRFVRAGAALDKPAQDRLAAINERLASLGTQFAQNVLADEKAYALLLEEGDLAGLPDFARANARAAAEERGRPGNTPSRWRAPPAKPSCSSRRAAICARKSSGPGSSAAKMAAPTDNRAIIAEMVALRGRAGKDPGLCDLRRLPARRSDGQDAGKPRASCSTRSGAARAQRPLPSATLCRR